MKRFVFDNVTLASLDRHTKRGVLSWALERRTTEEMIRRLQIRTWGPIQRVRELSGGNQQKVVIARWLASGCKILILDEPTRGVDIGAKAELYNLIMDMRDRGLSILLISSDLSEVRYLSDRIIVMRRGRIVASLQRESVLEDDELLVSVVEGGASSE